MEPINWDLLEIAFSDENNLIYNGTNEDLREKLELSGYQQEHIDKIVSDARFIRRIIGGK